MDAIVIGAGVIGAAVAFELAKRGHGVTIVDRERAAGHGSTAGSCAIIRMHYSTWDGTALAWEGYHYWRDWRGHLQAPDGEDLARYVECGCLVMKTEGNGYLEKHMANSRDLSIPLEEWDTDQIKAALPGIDLNRFAPARLMDDPAFGAPTGGQIDGAVFWPSGGYMTDPALSAKNLADAAQRHGAHLRLGATVEAILENNGRASGVRLAGGEDLHADVVVNVAGPASSRINQMAGVTDDMTIQTRALRQEVTHLPAPPDVYAGSGMVLSDSDACVYSRPEHGGNVLIGSEDPPCDTMEYLDDDTTYDRDFTDQWTTQALRMAQRFPSIGIPSRTKGVVDLYDAATDWIPIYDRSSLPGFYMACGTSGNQYKNAPIAGILMAELIDAVEGGQDHDNDPVKMTLPYVGREIDLGFYSRKRPINEQSSFSVLG
ncbi:MAG: FAD-binding oxidoreductase [Pseudomonadota bacterium]